MATYSNTNFVSAAGSGRPDLPAGYQNLELTVDLGSEDFNSGDGLAQGDYLNLWTLPTNTRVVDCSIAAITALTNGADLDVGLSDGDGAGVGADNDGIVDGFDGSTAGNNDVGRGILLSYRGDSDETDLTLRNKTASVVVATANVVSISPKVAAANVTGTFRIGLVVMIPVG